jgi:hypothetical protein
MRPGTTAETSDDVHAAQLVGRMLGQVSANVAATPRRCSREPVASRRRPDPNDPDGRSNPMLLFFLVAAPEIETPERAQWRDLPPPREAARRRDEHQEVATTPEE